MDRRDEISAHIGESLQDCLIYLGTSNFEKGKFCNATWDGLLCWPPTRAGLTIRQSCPFSTSLNAYAYKVCNKDGTWAVIGDPETHPGGHSPAGYTDYSQCFQPTPIDSSTLPEQAVFSDYNKTMKLGEIIQLGLSSVSIVSCLIAILFYFIITRKGVRCKIVIPLFLSIMTYHLMSLVAMTLRHVDKSEDAVHMRDYFCRLETVICKFCELATYSWLMILMIYYHLIAMCYKLTTKKILVLYVIGSGIPIITTMTWYLSVVFLIRIETSCFVDYFTHPTIWLPITVKFLCIFIILCLLVVCCCAFCCLHDDDLDFSDDFVVARQGILRVFIVTMVMVAMEIYLLVSDFSKGISVINLYIIHYFIWIICTTTKGLIFAFFLCFIDKKIWSCQTTPSERYNKVESRDKKMTPITNLEDIFGDSD
ncbi:hypothetical protein LOTGIDRAFT_173381 [Lottia gigantea]|uniref:G-protein coupled receptors family 2 profile 2 domain-containing protein n=1 Tax=Lottia gigantea TaxID=225164 RepID=V4CE38_LOTGI|nr:hypothetical protein LOTGIDRAFT_173381 [Lottia gigantea]ESP00220.1 hypothetical protein LOTGIDRAFT_173381 [Lottia gigantea]